MGWGWIGSVGLAELMQRCVCVCMFYWGFIFLGGGDGGLFCCLYTFALWLFHSSIHFTKRHTTGKTKNLVRFFFFLSFFLTITPRL